MHLAPIPSTSEALAVDSSSTQFTLTLVTSPPKQYTFVSTTNCWIAQGANPTASAASGSMFVPALYPVLIDGRHGAKLAVVRNTADGTSTLTELNPIV